MKRIKQKLIRWYRGIMANGQIAAIYWFVTWMKIKRRLLMFIFNRIIQPVYARTELSVDLIIERGHALPQDFPDRYPLLTVDWVGDRDSWHVR